MAKTCIFTIVANNYRHFARTLMASARAHGPDVDRFVVVCDEPMAASDPRDAFTEIPVRDLGLPQFDRFTFQYTILELNTAIKPWVFAALFARGYERVVYFDPDIKLYGSIAPVLAHLDRAQIVLTPHLTDRLDDGRHPTELSILQSGTYNLGFIALRQTEETRRFVEWWQAKLAARLRGRHTERTVRRPEMDGPRARHVRRRRRRARSRLERGVLESQPSRRHARCRWADLVVRPAAAVLPFFRIRARRQAAEQAPGSLRDRRPASRGARAHRRLRGRSRAQRLCGVPRVALCLRALPERAGHSRSRAPRVSRGLRVGRAASRPVDRPRARRSSSIGSIARRRNTAGSPG